jgi:hypothetical protein
MPIITKKDKLYISMTWASSDDKSEVDISVQREGDDSITIVMQSGRSSVTIAPSCVRELYDFLVDRGLLEPSHVTPSHGVDPQVYGSPSWAAHAYQEASDDVVGLLEEARRGLSSPVRSDTPSGQVSDLPSASNSVYASPAVIASMGGAAVAQKPTDVGVSSIAKTLGSTVSLPNESSDSEDEPDVVEMADVPPDMFGG